MMSGRANVYIDRFNFYLAEPIQADITNGWGNFKALGILLAKEHFGSGDSVGTITYITSIVEPRMCALRRVPPPADVARQAADGSRNSDPVW
jgi:hypothetical protein